jgi:non-ribosomal peptide synthetase component F
MCIRTCCAVTGFRYAVAAIRSPSTPGGCGRRWTPRPSRGIWRSGARSWKRQSRLPYTSGTWHPGARFGRFPCLSFEVTRCSLGQLTQAAARLRASTSALILAAFTTVLGAATGQDDLLLQAALADRGSHHKRSLIGFLVNRCVLRMRLSRLATVEESVATARTVLAKALRHQAGPFLKEARTMDACRVLNLTPRVTIAFNQELQWRLAAGINPGSADHDQGRAVGSCRVWESEANCVSDLHLEMLGTAVAGSLRFRLMYRPELWEAAAVQQLGCELADALLKIAGITE